MVNEHRFQKEKSEEVNTIFSGKTGGFITTFK